MKDNHEAMDAGAKVIAASECRSEPTEWDRELSRAILFDAAPILAAEILRDAANAFEATQRRSYGRSMRHWRGQDFEDGLEAAAESVIEALRARAESALRDGS